jgi:hypothetical protein
MKTLLISVLILFSQTLQAQGNYYNGISKDDYNDLTKSFVEAFRSQNFSLIEKYILRDSLETAKKYFNLALNEGINHGIVWDEIIFKYKIADNEITTGSNPTQLDISAVDRIIDERRAKGEYEVTIWAVCAYGDKLFEIEIGTFYEVNQQVLSSGEFYYYNETDE